jgi:thiamine transporter ThiT
MGALGNVLAIISISLGTIPSPITGQVAFDFSNLAVAIVAVYAGWRLGLLTGLIAGFAPGIWFGLLGSLGILGLVGLIFGKGLTGLTVGILSSSIGVTRRKKASFLVIPTVLVGYLPEFVFTVFFFLSLVPIFIGGGVAVYLVVIELPIIIVKAWAEMIIISCFMAALIDNRGFSNFIDRYLGQS